MLCACSMTPPNNLRLPNFGNSTNTLNKSNSLLEGEDRTTSSFLTPNPEEVEEETSKTIYHNERSNLCKCKT